MCYLIQHILDVANKTETKWAEYHEENPLNPINPDYDILMMTEDVVLPLPTTTYNGDK